MGSMASPAAPALHHRRQPKKLSKLSTSETESKTTTPLTFICQTSHFVYIKLTINACATIFELVGLARNDHPLAAFVHIPRLKLTQREGRPHRVAGTCEGRLKGLPYTLTCRISKCFSESKLG
jgi:hypothetical protein